MRRKRSGSEECFIATSVPMIPSFTLKLGKQAIHRLLEFEVSLKTGIRRSEQQTVRWEDVDFDRRIMRFRKTKMAPLQFYHH